MIVPGLLSPKHPLLDPTRSVLGTGLPWESGGGGSVPHHALVDNLTTEEGANLISEQGDLLISE